MSQFHIHFFKEKNRSIDLDLLVGYFDRIEGVKKEMGENFVRFHYLDPKLSYEALFEITPKSQVPDLYRLSPKFLDLNFHLSFPILTPDFVALKFIDIADKLCHQFSFHVYNELFEDVLQFKKATVFKVFQMIKDAYIDKNPVLLKDYYLLNKEKTEAIFRYLNDQNELEKHYRDEEIYVPKYHFFNVENKGLTIGIELKEQSLTVFPRHVDYLFYYLGQTMRVIPFKEALELIEKYLERVPGFIEDTFVMNKKTAKKVHKILKKTKFSQVNHKFMKTSLKQLMD